MKKKPKANMCLQCGGKLKLIKEVTSDMKEIKFEYHCLNCGKYLTLRF